MLRGLLAGKTPELVLGVADTDTETGTQLENNLEKAGFKITVKPIPADAKLDETSKKNNPWDLYLDSWAADWPSGAAILPVLFDGRTIKPTNNSNRSYVNNDAINAEFDRVGKLDAAAQAPEWAKLDERIMKELAPAVPLYVDVAYYLYGSKVGGLFISSIFGYPAFVNAYVKQEPDHRSSRRRAGSPDPSKISSESMSRTGSAGRRVGRSTPTTEERPCAC